MIFKKSRCQLQNDMQSEKHASTPRQADVGNMESKRYAE